MSSGQGRGRGRGFNPFYKRNQNSNQNNRQKPIFAVPQSSSTSNAGKLKHLVSLLTADYSYQ